MTIALADQLKCAKRELCKRREVYPWLTYMAQERKDYEMAAMEAIVATLEGLLAAQETTSAVERCRHCGQDESTCNRAAASVDHLFETQENAR